MWTSLLASIGFLNSSLAVLIVTLKACWCSHWIVDVYVAYDYRGPQHPIGVKAHSTRRMASSWAWANSVSIQDFCLATGWSIANPLSRFYNLDISLLALHFLCVQTVAKFQQIGLLLLDFSVYLKILCYRPIIAFDCVVFQSVIITWFVLWLHSHCWWVC